MDAPNLSTPPSTPQHLAHFTLNTGHLRDSPRSEVAAGVTEHLAPILQQALSAHHAPIKRPGDGDTLCLLTARRDYELLSYELRAVENGRLLVACACARDETPEAHTYLATLRRHADVPFPLAAPWLVVTLGSLSFAEAMWAGDLERCLAWAWCSA